MTLGFLVLSIALASAAVAPAAAADRPGVGSAAGDVAGRAVTDGRRPADAPVPVEGLVVELVPDSDALVARLEEIRRRARSDPRSYRTSAEAIAEALRSRLRDGASEDGGRSATTDDDGAFKIERVPRGAWLLIARRTVFVPRKTEPITRRERETYQPTPRLAGQRTVTVWLRRITVEAGRTTEVELTDRNAWMTALDEERTLGTDR